MSAEEHKVQTNWTGVTFVVERFGDVRFSFFLFGPPGPRVHTHERSCLLFRPHVQPVNREAAQRDWDQPWKRCVVSRVRASLAPLQPPGM